MMKIEGVYKIIILILIATGVFLINNYVKAQEINIEVLIDGVDDVPKVGRIGEPIKLEEYIEMWHSSGGYWIYEDIIIHDAKLNSNLFNEDALASAIKGEFAFEYELNSELCEKLIKTKNLKVVCS